MPRAAGTVLITGGTSGLGFEAALSITRQAPEWHIVLASRTNPHNIHEALSSINGHRAVSFMRLDLSSQENIREFARNFASKIHPPVMALLLNAGLQVNSGMSYSTDRVEKTFAVNHVGHALLFFLLRPHFADGCRIIITASGTHDPNQKTMVPDAVYFNAERLARPDPLKIRRYNGRQVYATSKLCNVLWTYALHRRLKAGTPVTGGAKWTVTAFDPGLMPGTGLARDAPFIQRVIWLWIMPRIVPLLRLMLAPNIHTTKESGVALAGFAVSDKAGAAADGKYFEGKREIDSSPASYDMVKQEDLWKWTINNLARDEDEKRAFEGIYPFVAEEGVN